MWWLLSPHKIKTNSINFFFAFEWFQTQQITPLHVFLKLSWRLLRRVFKWEKKSCFIFLFSIFLLHFIYFSNSHLIFAYDSLMKSSPCSSTVLLLHYVSSHSFYNLKLLFYFTFFGAFYVKIVLYCF